MAMNKRPSTRGQQREALIKMAADESELSRRTGNSKEQSTAGASARAKKYIEPVVDTTLNVTSLGGSVIGAAKMIKTIPTIVKGAVQLLTPRNAAKAVEKGVGKIAPEATTAQRKAVRELQKEAANTRMREAGYTKTPAAKARDATKVGGKPAGKPKENIYEESKRKVDPIPSTSDAGRPRFPGGVQTIPKPKPKPTPVSSKVPTGAKVAAATVAASPLLVPNEDEIDMAAINKVLRARKKGEEGSSDNPKYVGPPPKAIALKQDNTALKEDNNVAKKKPKSSFDPEPDPREDPSAWRKWNFKRVKAAEKAGVKPENIAKSSLDKEIAEREKYTVSDKKGGRIKTSPKVKRAVGNMVKPKKKTSSPRGAGCAQRGYGKAMMGGGKVKAYKAGGKVGGNRLY
jgi:hypothetical protein